MTDHFACVEAFLSSEKREAAGSSLEALDCGFAAIWQRAQVTLGDVTLTAIANRVLYETAVKHPVLAGLKLEGGRLNSQDVGQRLAEVDREPLAVGVRFALAEFLTLLGTLTGEILTPTLHAALSQEGLCP